MDWIEFEEQMAQYGIYVVQKPEEDIVKALKETFTVIELEDNKIQITQ